MRSLKQVPFQSLDEKTEKDQKIADQIVEEYKQSIPNACQLSPQGRTLLTVNKGKKDKYLTTIRAALKDRKPLITGICGEKLKDRKSEFCGDHAILIVGTSYVNGKCKIQFSAKIKIGDSDESMIPVEQKDLGADEISFHDAFFNKDQGVRVDVFLDDMGFMSSLQFKNQKYDLTCG